MIRTTLSCCALFGSLLVATHVVHRQGSEGLQPVDEVPTLEPVESHDFDPAVSRQTSGVVRASAQGEPQQPGVSVALALNVPQTATVRSTPMVAADDDALFDLVLEETPSLVHTEAAPVPSESGESAAVRLTQRRSILRFADGEAVVPIRARRDQTTLESSSLESSSVASESSSETAITPQASEELEDLVAPQLSGEMLALRDEIRSVLSYYSDNAEDVNVRSPWGIMHALIGYGVNTEVIANGRRVNAIGWLCWNGPCRGQRLFSTVNGELRAQNGPGVQGHEGQFLAMLAQSRVPSDFEMHVDGKQFTVEDLVALEQRGCRPNSELTFKLIGLSHYLDSDAQWTSDQGEKWNIPRLIQEELKQPVIGAACGGTHRMMGFSYSVRKREQRGEPIEGQWLRAKKYVDAYHAYTFKLQNRDGSFSTDWFRGRGDLPDPERRIQTTGHILEWLAFSLPQEDLTDPRVVRAVAYLTRLMNQRRTWEIGPKGHALHALVLYDERVFGRPIDASGDVARIDEPEMGRSDALTIQPAAAPNRPASGKRTADGSPTRTRSTWKLGR